MGLILFLSFLRGKGNKTEHLVLPLFDCNSLTCESIKPVLNWVNVCSPNILEHTMIRFIIEILVRRICFGQYRLYFILDWLVMRCKLKRELVADAQQTA